MQSLQTTHTLPNRKIAWRYSPENRFWRFHVSIHLCIIIQCCGGQRATYWNARRWPALRSLNRVTCCPLTYDPLRPSSSSRDSCCDAETAERLRRDCGRADGDEGEAQSGHEDTAGWCKEKIISLFSPQRQQVLTHPSFPRHGPRSFITVQFQRDNEHLSESLWMERKKKNRVTQFCFCLHHPNN